MKYAIAFEEEDYCIDGSGVVHVVASTDTPVSSAETVICSITLQSTHGVYQKKWENVLLPTGQTSVSVPYVVPLEWANDAIVVDFDQKNGDLVAILEVSYELRAGTQKFTAHYKGYGAWLPISVSADILPSVGTLTYTSVDGKVPSAWDKLVQGFSVVRVSAPEAHGNYNADIYRYYFNGGAAQSENFADISLTSAGAVTITVTVEDSRGRFTSEDLLLVVEPYRPPALTAVSSQRCDETGALSEEGSHFLASGTLESFDVDGCNVAAVSVAWKKVTETEYGESVPFTQSDSMIIAAELEEGASYDVRYTVSDAFYEIPIYDYLSSTLYLLHFLKGGSGIAVGKAAEQPSLFDVALATKFRRNVTIGGGVSVVGALDLDGVDVKEALQSLRTPQQTAFSVNTDCFPLDGVTENKIVRCGRVVQYSFQAALMADPLPGAEETVVIGTIPQGWFNASFLPQLTVMQNGVNDCRCMVSQAGQVSIVLSKSWQQLVELSGMTILLEE